MTDCVVPKALVRMTIAFGSRWRTFTSSSRPLKGCKWVSQMRRSGVSVAYMPVALRRSSTAVTTRVLGVSSSMLGPLQEIGLRIDDENGLGFIHASDAECCGT